MTESLPQALEGYRRSSCDKMSSGRILNALGGTECARWITKRLVVGVLEEKEKNESQEMKKGSLEMKTLQEIHFNNL